MATPRGAEHRDLEQRFRNLERTVRELVGAALRRQQLEVNAGDFVVSGGGRVRVLGTDSVAELAPDEIAIKTLEDGVPVPPNMALLPDGFVAADSAGNIVVFRIDEATGDAVLTSSNGKFQLPPHVFTGLGGVTHLQGAVWMPGLGTTGAGANLNWSFPNGGLSIVTSTERHKTDIGPAEVDVDAVLALQEVAYDRLDDPDPEHPTRYLGFIAERAHELGLTAWVVYDEDGLPWSFDYTGFAAVAHHAVLRKHEAELAEARARADDLERRLEALEAASS